MQAKSSSYQAITNSNAHACFYCGCGVEFTHREHFKEHSRRMHDSQYIQGSSHFLAAITEVVLPIQNNPCKQNHEKQEPNLKDSSEKIKYLNNPAKINHSPLNIQRKSKTPNKIKRRSPKAQIRKEKLANPQQILTHAAKRQQQLEWNGFKLIKNDGCDAWSYYCGVCKIDFALPEYYIIHCIDVCQSLHSPLSSHFITCAIISNLQDNPGNNAIQQKKPNGGTIKKRFQRTTERIITNEASNQTEENPLRMMFLKKREDHRHLPFYCGACHQSIPQHRAYYNHINGTHSEIVDPSSSHIILRTLFCKNKRHANLYISQNADQPQVFLNYYCPCKPQLKMSMKKLIKHVMDVHRGVSPFYSYRPPPHKRPTTNAMSQDDHNVRPQPIMEIPIAPNIIPQDDHNIRPILNVEIPQPSVDPILPIILEQRSQKKTISLKCLSCSQKLACRGYRGHLDQHRGERFDFSHVILRAKLKTQFMNSYIPVGEEWANKEAVYYCPCESKRKVKMSELVRHIIDAHNYVSPLYVFRG